MQAESQQQTELPEEDSPSIQSKVITLAVVLALAVVGYLLAPGDMTTGDYTATINVAFNGDVLTADFPFTISDETAEVTTTVTETQGDYTLVIEGKDRIANGLGERIRYRVEVLDAEGVPVPIEASNVNSMIHGPEDYEQSLPPTERADAWLVFAMRIPFKAKTTLALLFAVGTLWLTELIPLSAASMLVPVVIVIGGVTDARTVLQPFFDPIIVLFLAGFLMAEAMRRAGVDRRIALTILRLSSLKPAYLMLTMMGLTAFLSMWMSNTASVALIIPIAIAVLSRLPEETAGSFTKALILGVAYAGSMGGIGSAIGTPANILALTFLNDLTGAELTFNDWFAYGVPMMLIMIPIIWVYLILTFRVSFQGLGNVGREVYEQELKSMGKPDRNAWVVIGVFVLVVVLWLTSRIHGIPTGIVALIGVLILSITEAIKQDDLKRINWDALLTFGGGLAIGSMLVSTGVSDWIALQLSGLAGQPPMLVIFAVAALTLVVGAFISNTACAAMLIPLSIPLAQILGIDPRLMVAVVAIGSSVDFALVIGTPPTMIAYSTGYFKTQEIFRRGIILDVIGVALLSFGVIWIWNLLGVVTL